MTLCDSMTVFYNKNVFYTVYIKRFDTIRCYFPFVGAIILLNNRWDGWYIGVTTYDGFLLCNLISLRPQIISNILSLGVNDPPEFRGICFVIDIYSNSHISHHLCICKTLMHDISFCNFSQ